MKEGARRVVEACLSRGTILDLTGVHTKVDTVEEKMKKNGFLLDFQRFVVALCREKGVSVVSGADSHSLSAIGRSRAYYEALLGGSDGAKNNIGKF